MELLCITGVEDKLQVNVRRTLELLGNAGIKVRINLMLYVVYTYLNFFKL